MLAVPRLSTRRQATRALLRAAALASALVAAPASVWAQPAIPGANTVANNPILFMRVDGVKGTNPPGQPLGPDAFAVGSFTISTDPTEPGKNTPKPSDAERFNDVGFTLPISGPGVALWQLAADRRVIPNVSFVAMDPQTGKTRFRVDFENAVVNTMGLQSFGTRDASVGTITYQRVRIRFGEAKDAPTSSWDRVKNAPWK